MSTMSKLPFLSEQWLDAVKRLHEEQEDADDGTVSSPGERVLINQTVTGAPFGDGTVLAHIDTAGNEFPLNLGHAEGADVNLVMDYPVAKSLLVDGDPTAAMKAFMTGQLQVDGEMSKLIAAQQRMPDIFGPRLAARIREITA